MKSHKRDDTSTGCPLLTPGLDIKGGAAYESRLWMKDISVRNLLGFYFGIFPPSSVDSRYSYFLLFFRDSGVRASSIFVKGSTEL